MTSYADMLCVCCVSVCGGGRGEVGGTGHLVINPVWTPGDDDNDGPIGHRACRVIVSGTYSRA